jgi:hypothetical protein
MNSVEVTNQPVIAPNDIFVHEAGHALAYDALGIPLKSCSVFTFADSRSDHGLTKPNTDGPPMAFPSMCFVLMAGPAAHMFVAEKSFESAANRFFSDFAFLFRTFPQLFRTDLAAAAMIVRLRTFAETFCKEWALANKLPILRLARSLQDNVISPGHYELVGAMLNDAVLQAWQKHKPSAAELEAQVTANLLPLLEAPVEIPPDQSAWLENWIMRLETTII